MTTPTFRDGNPYVGPRSFQTGEVLYGRDREARDLLGLLVAERIVLLHSPSGAGKTSLLQAALIPQLREQEFDVLPVLRVSLESSGVGGQEPGAGPRLTPDPRPLTPNRYILSLLLSLEEGLPPEQQTPLAELAGLTLAEYLDRREAAGDETDQVLIFDQFEEILTVDPTNLAAKTAFFAQVGAALRNRRRWALFSMREDYVAALEPYLRPVPTRLSSTFRLDLLGAAAARQAIQAPASAAGVTFEDDAAAQLVDDLRRVQVQQTDGSVVEQLGPSVEPVQLQVVCFRLWERAASSGNGAARPGSIGPAALVAVGDVNSALSDYYSERVREVATTTGVGERAIREWFDRQLITAQGIRGQVLQTAGDSQGLSNHAIWPLIDAYLVRAEKRRGATWFELAHDRLIAPVRANNAAWTEANLSPLQRQADLWNSQNRPDGLLFKDATLLVAERWAADHAAALTPTERDFLESCRKVREIIRRARRNNRSIRVLLVVAIGLMLAASFAWSRATEQGARASRAERLAVARELSAAAVSNLAVDPQRSLLLALEAVGVSDKLGEPPLPAVAEALQQAAQESRAQLVIGDGSGLIAVAYSPDGRLLATANSNGLVHLWDAATGAPVCPFGGADLEGDPCAIDSPPFALDLAFSPDGQRLAVASADASVWDLASGERRSASTFSESGVTVDDQTGGVLSSAIESDVNGIAFSSDGELLAFTDEFGALRLWRIDSDELPRVLRYDDALTGVAFSPDNSLVVAGSADGTATVWEVASGEVLLHIEDDGRCSKVDGVDFSPDGTLIALACDNLVAEIWDVNTEDMLSSLQGHASTVFDVAFSPDGTYVATVSGDATAKLWNPITGRPILTINGHSGAVFGLAFQPDSARLATVSQDGSARVWSLRQASPNGTFFVAYSPRGDRIATASGDGARLWDAASGALVRQLPVDLGVSAVAFSPDGARLAGAGYDNDGVVWNLDESGVATLVGHTDEIGRVAFSADGQRIATAGDDGTARLWEAATGAPLQELANGHEAPIYGMALSPDGRTLATGGQDGRLLLWDLAGIGQARVLTDVALLRFNTVAFSPDGALLASGDEFGRVRLWDVAAGAEVRTLTHLNAVNGVIFSPDGARLASASRDKNVNIWEVATGRLLVQLPHPSEVYSVAFSPDGARIASASSDGVLRIFPLQLDALLELAENRVIRGPTQEECAIYPFEQPCPR